MRNGAEALIIRRIRMIMKDLRNQAKNAQDSTFAIFGWSETRAKSLLLLKNRILIRISEFLKKQNSNERLIFDEKRASRSTFAPQKSTKIKKAKSRTRSLKLAENQAETRR